MRGILALDIGGTKCEALALHPDGTIAGWGRSTGSPGTGDMRTAGRGRSRDAIVDASRQALAGAAWSDVLAVHPRGCAVELPGYRWTSLFITETQAALALARETAGIVVLAGTGAVVYGKTEDGRELTLDGLGPLIGDYGSAFHVGQMAIRAAAKSGWSPRYRTSLAKAVRRHLLGDPRSDDLGGRLIPFSLKNYDRADIAGLAEIVDREANAGDDIAGELLRSAASSLAETACVVIDSLGMANGSYPLVRTGSLITQSRLYWNTFSDIVSRHAPQISPVDCDFPPVVGVAILALEAENGAASAEPIETLLGEARKLAHHRSGQIG